MRMLRETLQEGEANPASPTQRTVVIDEPTTAIAVVVQRDVFTESMHLCGRTTRPITIFILNRYSK